MLVNKVANSKLTTLNLEDYFPSEEMVNFDLKDYLFMEMILKEKDFRIALKAHDWSQYEGKIVLVNCSADAIIPLWAYMLVATYAETVAADVFCGTTDIYLQMAMNKGIEAIDASQYQDQMLVIKGCGSKPVPPSAYLDITKKLRPFAKSIMFGEPCSTVPVFKRR